MTKKICFLTFFFYLYLYGKVENVSSFGECFAYHHNIGKIEINCNGKTFEVDNTKISMIGAKGTINGRSTTFIDRYLKFSWNKEYVLIPTFGDPTPGAGANGTDKDNLYEIIRLNTKTGEMKLMIRRREDVFITNFYDFSPLQVSVERGTLIFYDFDVLNNGKVIFYGEIIGRLAGQTINAIIKYGYFSTTERERFDEVYQVNTFARPGSYVFRESYPIVNEKNDGFYYTFNENGVVKLVLQKGFQRGGEGTTDIGNIRNNYNGEQITTPTIITKCENCVNGKNSILWGNMYPSMFTIDIGTGKTMLSSRFFPFSLAISGFFHTNISNKDVSFTTIRPFEVKDVQNNNSIYLIDNGKPYKINLGNNIGIIGRDLYYDRKTSEIHFISNGEIVKRNVNFISDISNKDGRLFIKGAFPDLNEYNFQVMINGVIVVPEGITPPSLKANKNEISFDVPANVYGKNKVEVIFSTRNGIVGAVNNGVEIEFPFVPVEMKLIEGEPEIKVSPGENFTIKIETNIPGKFSVFAEDVNGFKPTTIFPNSNTRSFVFSTGIYVSTKYLVKFIAINGEEKEISVFVEVLPPKVNYLTSNREDGKLFSNDEFFISGENLSPDGKEHLEYKGLEEFLEVKINGISCEIIFISSSLLQVKLPEFEVVDEEENWLSVSVFGRETVTRIRIEKNNNDKMSNRR